VNNAPGTNGAGTANSSGSPSGGNADAAPRGSMTAGTAGGATGGRIDGTVTQVGPNTPSDNVIKEEDAQNSKVDKKIKGVCEGC
jgi:hypothetical protein